MLWQIRASKGMSKGMEEVEEVEGVEMDARGRKEGRDFGSLDTEK